MKIMSYVVLIVVLLSYQTIASAAGKNKYPFESVAQHQQFYGLIKQLRCLVCQNEDLADSNADLAEDLRQQIYVMVKQGKTDQEIRDYMVARYGDFILFKPPLTMRTYVLWFSPLLLFLVGLLIVGRIVNQREQFK